eukprot:COSAG01_NODE_7174_length_3319_cov_2.270807_2_plen_334_part_00
MPLRPITAPRRCGGGRGSASLLAQPHHVHRVRAGPWPTAKRTGLSPVRTPRQPRQLHRRRRRRGGVPARPFPSSMFLDKNRRDIGKSQSIWTDFKMETAGSRAAAEACHRRPLRRSCRPSHRRDPSEPATQPCAPAQQTAHEQLQLPAAWWCERAAEHITGPGGGSRKLRLRNAPALPPPPPPPASCAPPACAADAAAASSCTVRGWLGRDGGGRGGGAGAGRVCWLLRPCSGCRRRRRCCRCCCCALVAVVVVVVVVVVVAAAAEDDVGSAAMSATRTPPPPAAIISCGTAGRRSSAQLSLARDWPEIGYRYRSRSPDGAAAPHAAVPAGRG